MRNIRLNKVLDSQYDAGDILAEAISKGKCYVTDEVTVVCDIDKDGEFEVTVVDNDGEHFIWSGDEVDELSDRDYKEMSKVLKRYLPSTNDSELSQAKQYLNDDWDGSKEVLDFNLTDSDIVSLKKFCRDSGVEVRLRRSGRKVEIEPVF